MAASPAQPSANAAMGQQAPAILKLTMAPTGGAELATTITAQIVPQGQEEPVSATEKFHRAPSTIARTAFAQMQVQTQAPTVHRPLLPAPPRQIVTTEPKKTDFFDLPAELRVEIYKLVLDDVIIHILPLQTQERHCPHALVRTSRQVRSEVLPLIHSTCQIRANVTDFNFSGMLAWIARIPPNGQGCLLKNEGLTVRLCTSTKPDALGDSTLRKWLKLRADKYRPQPKWRYSGPLPKNKVANDLKRRVKRMTEEGKRAELVVMLNAIGVFC